jgi:hypothetical protein
MLNKSKRDQLISILKPLEAKGKVKVNYDTGEVILLGKSEKENLEILQKFMYSDPNTCFNVLQQLKDNKNKEKKEETNE